MDMRKMVPLPTLYCAVALLVMLPALAEGQYIIGPEDVLEIKFWQENSLDATIKVREDGKISLDIIGEVDAAGLTTSDLEKKLVKQLSRYNKAITSAVVRVVQYGSQKVFVTGQVLSTGKYTFEQIPDLWTLINEAGGVTEFGDLSRVLLIRGGSHAGEVAVVNVASLVAGGKVKDLPKVQAGDAIEVPRTTAGLPAVSLSDQTEAKKIFYISGAVLEPGIKVLEQNMDILDGISMAGGASDNADLTKVTVISKDGLQTQIMKINMERFTETGRPGRYMIRPEDTIILSRKSRGFLGMGSIGDWVAAIGAISTIIFIYDRLSGNGG
jgi:protein involved in polysaccharide export with SLBB domain